MIKLFGALVSGEFIITRYESEGNYIIPDAISQERKTALVAELIEEDHSEDEVIPKSEACVSRMTFVNKVLDMANEEIVGRYQHFAGGLYSREDLQDAVTWCEVAYFLYYVLGAKKSLNWNNIEPMASQGICVLHHVCEDGEKVLVHSLADYKTKKSMSSYIRDMRTRARYIPLPLYCSFVDLVNSLSDGEDGIILKENEMFKEVSVEDFEKVF